MMHVVIVMFFIVCLCFVLWSSCDLVGILAVYTVILISLWQWLYNMIDTFGFNAQYWASSWQSCNIFSVECAVWLILCLTGRPILILFTSDNVFAHMPAFVFVCLYVCLCARLLKNACIDLDEMLRVDRWTNRLTFEPDPDALQRGILLRPGKNVLGARRSSDGWFWVVCTATCNFITSEENPTYWYWVPVKQRRVVLRHRNTVVRGKCTLPSAHLVADEIYA